MTETLRFESASARQTPRTIAGLPSEDIVVLQSGTPWQVAWELQMLGPFASCGLLDGESIRHVTVPAMVSSAVTRSLRPQAALVPSDYARVPVFAAEMTLFDAASLVASTGWELAVVMDHEPRVITARSVFRALIEASPAHTGTPAAHRDVWAALRAGSQTRRNPR
ncbi:MAG: hypothetical protein WCK21_02405 [Actinomycetota bacterium]